MPKISQLKDNIKSIEAEEAVLGSILISNEAYQEIRFLQPNDFFELKNAWIFAAMRDLLEAGYPVDNLTIVETLRGRTAPTIGTTMLEAIGGPAYITYLINSTPTHIYCRVYAGIVEAASRKRRALELAGKLAQVSIERTTEEILQMAQDITTELQAAADRVNDTDGLQQFLYHISELKNLPPLTWLVPGEIPEHGLTLVYGRSGVGKSFFVLDYALTLSQEIPVVYIATEGETGYTIRVAAWAAHHHINVNTHYLYFYMNVVCLLDEKERERFSRLIKNIHPKLIIVDTLAHSMLPGNENDSRDMGMFLRASKKIQQEHQCAVLLVHHTNKGGLDERGHSSLRAACDMMIRLDEEDQIITVQCAKSKDAVPFPTRYVRLLPVKLDDGQSSPVLIAAEKVKQTNRDPLTPMQKQVLEAFGLETFVTGASMSEISEVTKITRGTVQKVASRLTVLGFLTRAGNGSYQISESGRMRLTPDSSLTPVTDSSDSSAKFEVTPVSPQKHDSGSSESGVS